MMQRKEILQNVSKYDLQRIAIASICSHSSLQIFYGAKMEGFKTIGICIKDKLPYYQAFPEASPEMFIVVDDYKEVLEDRVQKRLLENNSIVIAHGSFVEYVGVKPLLDSFYVPMYGNRNVLEWEADREKQLEWFEKAGLRYPKVFKEPSEIDRYAFVKVYGARGGKGYFKAKNSEEYHSKMNEKLREGVIEKSDRPFIQEFIAGSRYYPHYFYTEIKPRGLKLESGGLELLSVDRRIEPIDEVYRGLPDLIPDYLDYTVSGNQPVVLRESLIPEVLSTGAKLVKASIELFPPGILGPFCIEMVFNPNKGFIVFEVSARIVAGTNLYPNGSPYTPYIFKEPMSTGRRIALNIKEAIIEGELHRLFY
ncbi:MAG: formate--phosphoribosylaminoimidazolecarboxamide ligase [Nitrososphaeria archaeon]